MISIPVVISLMNGSSRTSYQATPRIPPIDASLVKLTDTREISNGSRKQLLLMMRNETGKPINAPSVSAQFYQGDLAQNSASGSPLSRTLLPGEYSPVLIDLPSQPYSRYELRTGSVSPAMSAITRQVAASKVQLVQNDGAHRLVGILKNEGASAISGAQVTVMLYDAGGKLIGSGNGYGAAGSLAAGAATTFDVRCELYGDGAVASYEYMVQTTASGGQDASTQANAGSRMQRISPAAIRAIPKPRLTALELLDENFALFDPAQLKLSAPRRLLDEIDRPGSTPRSATPAIATSRCRRAPRSPCSTARSRWNCASPGSCPPICIQANACRWSWSGATSRATPRSRRTGLPPSAPNCPARAPSWR